MPAPHRLYPLLLKPGILRDGTSFQGEYCADGQWIRFQNGRPKTIGGYVADTQNYTKYTVNNLLVFYKGGNRVVLTSLYGNTDHNTRFYLNGAFAVKGIPKNMTSLGTFLFERMPGDSLMLMYVQDNGDIGTGTASQAWMLDLKTLQGTDVALPEGCNGGMRFVPPYLFVWGMNGTIRWSSPDNVRNFDPQDKEGRATGAGGLTLSNDKVIQGYALRGGAQSPAILFWTLNRLVRVLNVGVDQVIFKADMISQNVSILSRSCVVEVDGLFFWPGTDRFFVYNGTVQEVPNTLNLNWFYDNLDMSRRQQVVGVRNQKYGEIWWFYPDKRDGKPYNTRAMIYNKRENTWYDTRINRDAAFYDDVTGTLFAAGQSLAEDGWWQLWAHEQGTCGQDYQRNVFPIPSFLESPVISWVSVSPQKEEIGLDRRITLERLEPDFKMVKGVPEERKEPDIAVSVIVQDYAQSPSNLQKLGRIVPDTEHLDPRIEGRQMRLKFSSEDAFEMGHVLLQFDVGAAQ